MSQFKGLNQVKGIINLFTVILILGSFSVAIGKDRPNILWITAEDMSPTLGCYGDKFAITPNIDKLSTKSVMYTKAFATAPVCSPSRSCLINGLAATSQGTQNMRSAFPIPNYMLGFPSLLRNEGYFTSNNVKTDYNSALWSEIIKSSWVDQGDKAHWRNRKGDKPFFSIFNLMTSHQSRSMVWPYEKFKNEVQSKVSLGKRHNPDKTPLPPYYTNSPVVKKTVARFYDCVTAMDKEVGDILKQLKQDGLAENTIVFFYSDHGSGMPRHKRALLDSGMKVPLLIHFPKKWEHLAPAKTGAKVNRLVNFADFAPSLLNMLNIKAPSYMEGKPFLGKNSDQHHDYVFGHRDRVDEVLDFARSVRSQRYLYIKNYMPHLSYNQKTAWPDLGEIRHEFYAAEKAGGLTKAQKHFMGATRPAEELYDCVKDPNNLNNLIGSSKHSNVLNELRTALKDRVLSSNDLGYIPEPMLWELTKGTTPYEWIRDYDELETIFNAATQIGLAKESKFLKNVESTNPAVRYWSIMGLRALETLTDNAISRLTKSLTDSSVSVRIIAAETLATHGHYSKAIATYKNALEHENLSAVQVAARSVENLGNIGASLFSVMEATDKRMKTIRPPGTSPVVVQSGDMDMAMFIGFSTEAYLKYHSKDNDKTQAWTPLFDGKSLKGWEAQAEGDVKVKNGEIQILSVKKNLWLLHEKTYSNFELEVEAKMPTDQYNSGIGFRCSNEKKVLGYQCEIAEKKSGSMYAIGKGWVVPQKGSWDSFYNVAKDSFKSGEWNKFKIRCEGSQIKVWVNGHLTIDTKDEMYKEGRIALQHHGKGGLHHFKNVKIKEL